MTEEECLAKMAPPGRVSKGRWGGGIIQIIVTHSCDRACSHCTQGSNLAGPKWFMSLEHFRSACRSLSTYHGVAATFGGNPALHPQFNGLCKILREEIPFERRGLWCNNPITLENAKEMARTYNPKVSNLNVHMDKKAHDLFVDGWPELARHPSNLFGLNGDSRHSPVWGSMRDLGISEGERHELISRCPINQNWSPLIGVFRGELRAWFCEIAGAQSMRMQHLPEYPDTGIPVRPDGRSEMEHGDGISSQFYWWQKGMEFYADQVRHHCHDCLVPLNGYGALAVSDDGAVEQHTKTYAPIFKPKKSGRAVELVTAREQLMEGRIGRATDYLKNAKV